MFDAQKKAEDLYWSVAAMNIPQAKKLEMIAAALQEARFIGRNEAYENQELDDTHPF